ncbi:MAG TPA: hypothetical protein VFZ66_26330 [Herpetosiphonaceae bacterium]
MPTINVLYWNIQNFGIMPGSGYKNSYDPLCGFIAAVADLVQADIICIQELRQAAILNNDLQRLQRELCALPAPRNNWYYDWIKGAVGTDGAVAVAPFNLAAHLDWDSAHYEGYAIFWNQNLAKFKVQASPPITTPAGGGPFANSQSQTVRGRGSVVFGAPPAVPLFGIGVPAGGIVVPPNPAFTLPVGTTAPGGAGINNGGPMGPVVLAAGAVLGAAANVNGGTVLPVGTLIGAAGVQLTAPFMNINPVVIPGNYTLTEPLTLPAPGSVVVPEYGLSLVLMGRDTRGGGVNPATLNGDVSGATANFNPAAAHPWQYLYFTRGAGMPAAMRGCRRPSYITIDVNRNPPVAAAQRLVPVIMYHAPSAAPASSSGMQRAAYSRELYQAYDPGAAGWINNTFAVLGGDFNVATDSVAYAYNAFLQGFGLGGANCVARVYNAAPAPTPAIPAPTRADNVLNKSTAQVNNPPVGGGPVINAATNAYRLLAIDNVFYRGFGGGLAPAPVPAGIYDLLTAVTGAAAAFNMPAASIMPFANIPIFNQHWNIAWGLAPGPGPATPNIQSINNFVFDLGGGLFAGAGAVPPARRAAEFVHLCVSDHLPVLFTMNL